VIILRFCLSKRRRPKKKKGSDDDEQNNNEGEKEEGPEEVEEKEEPSTTHDADDENGNEKEGKEEQKMQVDTGEVTDQAPTLESVTKEMQEDEQTLIAEGECSRGFRTKMRRRGTDEPFINMVEDMILMKSFTLLYSLKDLIDIFSQDPELKIIMTGKQYDEFSYYSKKLNATLRLLDKLQKSDLNDSEFEENKKQEEDEEK